MYCYTKKSLESKTTSTMNTHTNQNGANQWEGYMPVPRALR